MDNNEYKINWKEIISFVLFCIALQLYQSNINIINILIIKDIIYIIIQNFLDSIRRFIMSEIYPFSVTKKYFLLRIFFVSLIVLEINFK